MSPKKERGKQRKAAKNLAAASGAINVPKTLALLRKGDNKATKSLGGSDSHTTQSLKELSGILYEQSGILSTVLKFLKRCEDDTFVKVMLDVGGGNLKTPKAWVSVLIQADIQEESCRLHIAQNIGPLVRCMCNDTERQFFRSNKHWADTMQAFVCLIHNMILSCFNSPDTIKGKKIIDTLLNYEGLLLSIIQWGFWDEEYRPDITKKLPTKDCVDIVESGRMTVKRLITAADTQTEEDRKRLEIIGTTPIISKEYDPECTISFVVGLVRLVKIKGWTMLHSTSQCLRRLIANVSCVDKDVITELIDLGINTKDDTWVVHVAISLRYIILKKYNNEKYYANDTRIAFAIRGGLIELCLTFIERFGLLESFDKKKDTKESLSLYFVIKNILNNIYRIGLHKKTAKAVRSKRCSVEKELARLERNADIMNNVNCKKVLDMVRAILDINGSYCCRCNKSLIRTEVKQCNDCNIMVYCSKTCQKEDWSKGHSLTCCKSYTIKLVGHFQGRHWPEEVPSDERPAAKLKELEINLSSVQLKLFLDHSEIIQQQASSLDTPLYDCVVYFDLRDCPLSVEVIKYTDFDDPGLKRGFEYSRSKKNITCNFISNIYDGSLDEGQVPILETQRLFPHNWLSNEQEKRSKQRQRMKVFYLEEMCKHKRKKRLERLSRDILSFS